MQHHCHNLTRLRVHYDVGAVDLGIVACGIRCELAANEFCQRDRLPSTEAQQLVSSCHRANACVKRFYEVDQRLAALVSLENNRADGCKRVLDTMVELTKQYAVVF